MTKEHQAEDPEDPKVFIVFNKHDNVVAVYQNLESAIDICSRRHHFVKNKIWRNLGYELDFDDYHISSMTCNTFPTRKIHIQYDFYPESRYSEEIQDALTKKKNILDRAKTAEDSLQAIENAMCNERGPNWKCTLQDKEIDILVLFEDAMYEETMYEPWATTPPKMKYHFFDSMDKRYKHAQ